MPGKQGFCCKCPELVCAGDVPAAAQDTRRATRRRTTSLRQRASSSTSPAAMARSPRTATSASPRLLHGAA
eukprot:9245916-Alexandrium_andersonii.AAC.1